MSEVFSLEEILGPPKSSIRLNYEFNFIGKNTHLIGTKSTSYPPIHDDLVEKEIVKEEEGDWFGWGLNLVIGIAVTAACAVVAVAAAPVTVTVAVVAGCAAVGSEVATTAIAVSDYHDGKPHPRAWWEAAGGILFGAGIGAIVGAELYYFPSMIAGTAEVAGIQASMWAGASSMFTSVAVPKLATGLGYGLLGMNAIFGLDQASGVGDGETLLRRQNPELYDNLAMLSMILTEGYSAVGAAQQAMKGKSSGDNEDGKGTKGAGGATRGADWSNKTSDLSKKAPIKVPEGANVKVQTKNGYDQITYKWSEGGCNYEVRWHTRTPGAPESQGNTWVVSKVTPGTPTGQLRTEHILVGEKWIPRYQWQEAISANKNGTATTSQLKLLEDGHWKAP